MNDALSPLEGEIRRRSITGAGPMPLAEYMRLCLTHPQYGYYINRDPLGAGGDFVTSPEISQMFGELIGLWMAAVWRQMGTPENIRVVELGPGPRHPDARCAAGGESRRRLSAPRSPLHLVEVSPALQQIQQRRLEPLDMPMLWHDSARRRPAGPSIIVANEFIDALPIHQAVKQADGWHERVVEIGADGNLVIGAGARSVAVSSRRRCRARLRQAPDGSIYEWRADGFALELGRRMRADGRRPDHRLWPRPIRVGRHAAGGRRTFLHRSAARAGQGRSDRPCRFRGAGADARKAWAPAFTDRSGSATCSAAARHRTSARRR